MNAERLSALDVSFLDLETPGAHMQIGALATVEAEPLRRPDGGIDFDRISRFVAGLLPRVPRYRQRLARAPGLDHPYWVDDEHFRLAYHVRHTALPRPGSPRQLKRLAGRVFSQKLDPERPLWELWVVEGLEGDHFGLILKAHHSLADGVAGAGLLTTMFTSPEDPPDRWRPRPAPPRVRLLAEEIGHRLTGWRQVPRIVRRAVDGTRGGLHAGAAAALRTTRVGLSSAAPTQLNPRHVSPHRRFDGLALPLAEVKEIKARLGGKLNDAVLTIAAGGIGRYLRRQGIDVARLGPFRALCPVNTRGDRGGLGNRVALMFATLPLGERDPVVRHAKVREETSYAKGDAGYARASELFEDVADATSRALVTELMRLAVNRRAFNVIITNIPGPPFDLHLLGCRLATIHPQVPLYESQALGIALLSYAGTLFWGFNADWSVVGDLHLLVADVRASFEEVRDAARRSAGSAEGSTQEQAGS
ncbi:MAG: wax ester/triacylglycerol synthase family O-acyltransferase [Sandaracinaceae bacterium]